MLELTGLLILGVAMIMVGKTVQVCQVVGWVPVHPIGDLRLPYWAGLWFGVFPTWEGLAAQLGVAAFVLGSYVGAEWLHARRRRAKLATLRPASEPRPVRLAPRAAAQYSLVPDPAREAVGVEALEQKLRRLSARSREVAEAGERDRARPPRIPRRAGAVPRRTPRVPTASPSPSRTSRPGPLEVACELRVLDLHRRRAGLLQLVLEPVGGLGPLAQRAEVAPGA